MSATPKKPAEDEQMPLTGEVSAEIVVAEPDETIDDSATEWPHEWIEFEGDKLAVRKPTQQALAGFSLGSGKYIKPNVRNDVTGAFIANHMSEEAFSQVWGRLMNPDEPDYTVDSIGQLMRMIVELTTGPQE